MMLPCLHRNLKRLGRWVITLALGILVFCPAPSPALSHARNKTAGPQQGWEYRGNRENKGRILIAKRHGKHRTPRTEDDLERYLRDNRGLSPEEKARLKRKYHRWKSLDPDEQKALRYRFKKWQELGPEDRKLYKRRFRQWQNLTPRERQRIREELDKGNGVRPEEKEKIREMFR